MIRFDVIDNSSVRKTIEVPEEINLNLMEVLKASEYPVLATCGGMALCATCKVEIEEGIEKLSGPTDAELDMLEQLPTSGPHSRLACQIKITERLEGVILSFKES
jgi:2Fe-2S ferredoxin